MKLPNLLEWSNWKLFKTNLVLLIINSVLALIPTVVLAFAFLILPLISFITGGEKENIDKPSAMAIAESTLHIEITDCELIKGENRILGKWGTEFGSKEIQLSFPNKDVFTQIKKSNHWKDLSKDKALRQQLEKDRTINKVMKNGHWFYGFSQDQDVFLQNWNIYAVYDADTDRLYLEISYS